MAELMVLVCSLSVQHGVPPEIATAIVQVESSWNPRAIGSAGEVGLFQLHPKFHVIPETTEARVEYAIRELAKVRRRAGGDAWFVAWNYGVAGYRQLGRPEETKYYKRVMANRKNCEV